MSCGAVPESLSSLRIRPMQNTPATTAVTKLMMGRTTAATQPKNALVTRMESAPVSGAVIRNDMQEERDAPFLRISATIGTTEQLHRGTGTPSAALLLTDFRLSCFSHRRMASLEMNTWISPERNKPSSSMGARRRKDDQRKPKNPASSPLGSIGTIYCSAASALQASLTALPRSSMGVNFS